MFPAPFKPAFRCSVNRGGSGSPILQRQRERETRTCEICQAQALPTLLSDGSKLKLTPLKAGFSVFQRDKEQEHAKPKREQQPSNNFDPSRNSSLVWGGEADSVLTQASPLGLPLCGTEIRRINERVEKTEKERTQTEERLVLAWCSFSVLVAQRFEATFFFIFFSFTQQTIFKLIIFRPAKQGSVIRHFAGFGVIQFKTLDKEKKRAK